MRSRSATSQRNTGRRVAGAVLAFLLGASLAGAPEAAPTPGGQENDLDALMAAAIANRDQTWRHLRDYVLDERERFEILGPGGWPLHRLRREFTWYSRDGMLVRSPVRFDGVTIAENDRRDYESRWMREEQERERRRAEKRSARSSDGDENDVQPASVAQGAPAIDPDLLVREASEPRFVSEAYFLRFPFEPGNYYFSGRETLDGREVVRVEYYPTRLFSHQDHDEEDDEEDEEDTDDRRASDDERRRDADLERKFEKVAMVTLWVDPQARQIVKYTFENMDFGFLPLRSLVRFDAARASMSMGRFLDGVWLPRAIAMDGRFTLAAGSFSVRYGRDFSGYRQAETAATIRGVAMPRD